MRPTLRTGSEPGAPPPRARPAALAAAAEWAYAPGIARSAAGARGTLLLMRPSPGHAQVAAGLEPPSTVPADAPSADGARRTNATAPRLRGTHRTPASGGFICVGREAELSRLLGAYDAAAAGASRLTLVHGQPGAGKSRVLSELGRRLRLEGSPVLDGRAEPGRPFGAFASIVEKALRFLTEVSSGPRTDLSDLSCREGCHAFWYQHEHAGPPHPSSRGAGQPEAFDSLLPPSDGGRFGSAKVTERRLRFFDAVSNLLREVAAVRAPVVLIHDLDRACLGTAELLDHLLDRARWAHHGLPEREVGPTAGALFVASCRSAALAEAEGDATDRSLGALLARPDTELLELGPLDADGVRAYLQSPEAVELVLERTQGVPEQVELLLQARPLRPEESLRQRLEELPAGARAMVETLAVLGHSGDPDTLARVGGVRSAPADLAALRRSPLLIHEVLDGRVLFAFARESERERAYGLLPEARRRELHSALADHFAGDSELSGGSEQAARHALLAGDLERALPLVAQAARSLAARHAHAEAAALVEELPDATLDSDPDLLANLSELHRVAGDYQPALRYARRLCTREPASSAAWRRLGDLLTQAGQLDEATEALTEARRLAAAGRDAMAAARAQALLAELYYQRAAYAEAQLYAQDALRDAGDDVPLAMHARNTLGKVALAQREAGAATDLFEENRRLAQRHGFGHAHAQALTNLGVSMLRRQDFDAARAAFEEAIEVAARSGDTRDHAIATENLAVLAHLRRDAASALRHYDDAIAQLKRLGNRAMLARVSNNLGELYLSLGDRARARSLCDFATHMGGVDLSPAVTAEGLLLRGRVNLAEAELSEARACFEAAASAFDTIGEDRIVDASLALVAVQLAEGRVAEAEADVAELERRSLSPKRAAELALLRASLERAAGRATLASASRACELAERSRDPFRLVPALLARCEALLDADGRDRPESSGVGQATAEAAARANRDLERASELERQLEEQVPEASMAAFRARPVRRRLEALGARLAAIYGPTSGLRATRPSRPPESPERAEARRLKQRFPELAGSSARMTQVLGVVEKVAPTDAMVLIRGESGTGKELVAEGLHRHSKRADKPIVKVNCAALVETLLLSELFGHERGAFTGATSRKKGRFELADGGTIFLDEIGDISPKTQVALLRVLQERRFERVGGTQPVEVNVRILAATHRDLEAMVREGSFREDLYYRLRGVMVELPSLRDRLEDLPELADHLLRRIADERGEPPKRLSPHAAELLATHAWPGNVRELENVLRSATLFADEATLTPAHFDAFVGTFSGGRDAPRADGEAAADAPDSPGPSGAIGASGAGLEDLLYTRVRGGDLSLLEMKKELERECIARALSETDGNITQAANLLGMKRPRLSQLVKQYELSRSSSKRTS